MNYTVSGICIGLVISAAGYTVKTTHDTYYTLTPNASPHAKLIAEKLKQGEWKQRAGGIVYTARPHMIEVINYSSDARYLTCYIDGSRVDLTYAEANYINTKATEVQKAVRARDAEAAVKEFLRDEDRCRCMPRARD